MSWTAPPTGGPPTSYNVTPYIGTTAQTPTTVTGTPPATSTTVTGLTNGTAYTFKVTATNAVGDAAVRRLQRGHPDRGRRARRADRRHGRRPARVGARELDRARDDGGSAITGYTVTPFVGARRAETPVAVDASTTDDTRHRADQRHRLHVQGHRHQRRWDRPGLGRLQRRHAEGLDLRVHDAGRRRRAAIRARSCSA